MYAATKSDTAIGEPCEPSRNMVGSKPELEGGAATESASPPPLQSPRVEADDEPENDFDNDGDIDPANYDGDSAYGGDDYASETASLSSDIMKYRHENGRTYHSYGSTEHWGPNDAEAMEQQDLSHHFWTMLLDDKFFLAPVENPQKILDLGTGTGIWAMDVADRFPAAEVKGIDLSPIQPVWTAPNCFFEIDDYNIADWGIGPKYDLIHSRELLGSVANWPTFFDEVFKALAPGGWVDCAEPDIHVTSSQVQLPEDDPYKQWGTLFHEVSEKSGMTFEPANQLKGWMEAAGFVNVVERVYQVPVGVWAQDKRQKTLGLWNQARLSKGMRDFTERRMRTYMGWNDQEIDVLIAQTRNAVQQSKLCAQQNMYFVYGQKPLEK